MDHLLIDIKRREWGKIEGGEERFKKPSVISPIHEKYITYWYINFIIQLSVIDKNV